jgi:hypothetical protein
MPTITEIKEQAVAETPLVLFHCAMPDGTDERWCTHRVSFGGHAYDARVLRHNVFEMKWGAEDGIDSVSRVGLTLINADSRFSQLSHSPGWKGARLTATFVFFNLKGGVAASEPMVLFRGLMNPPEEIGEATVRLSATNRLNPQRMLLPSIRIQRRCPWSFPATVSQRAEAVDGGAHGKYSSFHRCGYSADREGGLGNLDSGGAAYTSCDYTRGACEQRGMFDRDSLNRVTRRFGGVEFVPASTLVRGHGERAWHESAVADNQARYNDYVPVVYGTAWVNPPVVFARNDGNLTRMEVLLGVGEINRVVKVVVNNVEIPQGVAGTNMTATGWYNVVSAGSATGGFNLDFPGGDPYGSMSFASVVVPNRVSDSKSVPRVSVLMEGLRLQTFATDGSFIDERFTSNPAWVLLDLLRRSGWSPDEIDFGSFAQAAEHCAATVAATDLNGNPVSVPRFQCNLVMRRRRSVADWLRGVRNGARLFLSYSAAGLLQLRVEGTAAQQGVSYAFGDGSGLSGIARRADGSSSVRLWARGAADSPNRVSIEFQDQFNEYQQDSLSLADIDDVVASRQEVSATSTALGVANFHQAARVLRLQLDKAVRGNLFIEFETSVKGVGLRPGDIVTVSYQKEGFVNRPFRITRITPALNFGRVLIEGQSHEDVWYADEVAGGSQVRGRQAGGGLGLPRPLVGSVVDSNGLEQFGIEEQGELTGDGTSEVVLAVSFAPPTRPSATSLSIPRLSLTPAVLASGGSIPGGQVLYYAVTAVDAGGGETGPSFVVRAPVPSGSSTNQVRIEGLSFAPGTTALHVYRGPNPYRMYRVAAGVPVAATFTDSGLASILAGPPDENFDHARFEWRLELHPETSADIYSPNTVGASGMTLTPNEFAGMVVRITRGAGGGQERFIESHTATTIAIRGAWAVAPDATSKFAIAEAAWNFGATSQSSPVRFRVPNRPGATVHVTGRAVNAQGRDSGYDLAPHTRWQIGGEAGGLLDADVPPPPTFGFVPTGQGTLELVSVAFATLANTRTVSAGTLRLFYWNELQSPSPFALAAAVGAADTTLAFNAAIGAQAGDLLQVGGEVMEVDSASGATAVVLRGSHDSPASSHAAGDKAYLLDSKAFVIAFSRDFFGSPASGSFAYPIFLPDVRVAAADFHVTNSRGNSETAKANLMATTDYGLRTLSGGQLTIQVEGYLAIQTSAAPPLVVEDGHSVRDIFAVVREAPTGAPVQLALKRNGNPYCSLTIPTGSNISNVVDGFGLSALAAFDEVTLDVVSVGSTFMTTPGRDLTVTVRL